MTTTSGDALWVEDLYELHAEHERVHWWFNGRREIVKAVVNRVLSGVRDALVVDVGCGTGANVAAMADRYRAIGIEPSTRAVELANKRFPNIDFIAGHAPQDLGEAASQADLFLLMDVLEHVPDDFALVSNILAVAKPGAQMLITVPADESLWSQHDVTLGHFRRYTAERLASTWEGLPVSARLLSPFNARLRPLFNGARRLGTLLGRSLGQRGTDQTVPPEPVNGLLRSIFAGEARRLVAAVDRGNAAFRRGVSLIAVVQRREGEIQPRTKPATAPPDRHDPYAGRPASSRQ